MKRAMAAILVLSTLAVIAAAQPNVTTTGHAIRIKALAILGKGIASNPSDPMDFMIVKFGIGKIRVSNGTVFSVGVLKLDDDRYRLRQIMIEDDHATGKIYSNGSEVGSFDMSSVMKGETEVWAGTMDLNGVTYNTYVIEGVRPIRPSELKDKVVEYCRTHEDANCRDRLKNYCENHPRDSRCVALFRAYCMNGHMDDIRCRQEFSRFCKEHPKNAHCIPFELKRAKRYCEEHANSTLCRRIAHKITSVCENNPNNEGCAIVKQVIQNRPLLSQRLQILRERLRNIRARNIAVNVTSQALLGGV